MKIKQVQKSYAEVMALPRPAHKKPVKPNVLMRSVIRVAGLGDLKATGFTYTKKDMEKAGDGPWLILMNHSSFLDLSIAARILYPRPYGIVCTSDGFVGKEGLMRALGCIPTQKFVSDAGLIADIKYSLTENKTSVLMYPEASYSFDGTATPLPRKMGVLLKSLKVPVIMITTYGSFARDPLYNNLQKRKVKVSAEEKCLFSAEEVASLSVAELDAKLDEAFSFDYFRWQEENHVVIDEAFRADGLNRILFKCPHCGQEGQTEGKGTGFICRACGKKYTLDTLGRMQAEDGSTEFPHIPDWYAWERQEIRKALTDGSYRLDTEVEIGLIVDFKAVYMVGEGHLTHDKNGFVLTGCGGELHYEQGPLKCYSLYADYFWYEIGDIICLGDKDCLYYCFPKQKDVAARTRIAVEELYKLAKEEKRARHLRKE